MATIIEGYQYASRGRPYSYGTVSFNTAGTEITTAGCREANFSLAVTGIGQNIQVRLEGKMSTAWVTVQALTITKNGTYLLSTNRPSSFSRLRIFWATKAGGSPAVSAECMLS